MIQPPNGSLPRRFPGVISRITSAIRRKTPELAGPDPDESDTSQTGVVSQLYGSIHQRYFELSDARHSILKDVDEMDRTSEEASVALDTIADNVCTSEDGQQVSFVVLSENKQTQTALDELNEELRLHELIRSIIRNLVKDGDLFGELVVNKKYDLVTFRQLPASTMHRNQDIYGNLRTGAPVWDSRQGQQKFTNNKGECAYDQIAEDGTLLASFWPWQIVHERFNWNGRSPHGKSHLAVARYPWKKLKALEESLIIGRLTRDLLKLVFYIDTTGLGQKEADAKIAAYQNKINNKQRVDGAREQPFSVFTDFFMSDGYVRVGGQAMVSRSRIDVIDPKNEGLHQIEDVKHQHRKFISTVRVPASYMNFEENPGGKMQITQQDVQYVRWLRYIQQCGGRILSQIYDVGLLLKGIDPETAEYKITWPKLKSVDEQAAAEALFRRAQSVAIFLGTGPQNSTKVMDREWVQKNILDMTDDQIAAINVKIDAETAKEQQQQEALAEKKHKQAMEIASTAGAGRLANGNNSRNAPNNGGPGKNDTQAQRERNLPVSTISKKGVQSEQSQILSDIIDNKLGNLAPELQRIMAERELGLWRAIATMTGKPDAPVPQELKLEPHMSFEFKEGMIRSETSVTVPEREVKLEHHMHIDEGAIQHTSQVDAHTTIEKGAVLAPVDARTNIEAGAIQVPVEVNTPPAQVIDRSTGQTQPEGDLNVTVEKDDDGTIRARATREPKE